MARGFCVLIVLLVTASEVHAGVIRGRLSVPRPRGPAGAGGTQVATGGPEDAVVWVDSLPPRVLRRCRHRLPAFRIVQRGWRFAPRVTAVAAGTTIRFVNRDPVYHNVFSVSPAKKFDLGKYPPRATNQVTFDRTGVVNLYCDVHPGMEAYVVVLPHRVFARPDRRGDFALPVLPGGAYQMHVWHPNFGVLHRRVELPARGDLRIALGY
jgi:hypothetical protein